MRNPCWMCEDYPAPKGGLCVYCAHKILVAQAAGDCADIGPTVEDMKRLCPEELEQVEKERDDMSDEDMRRWPYR